MTDTWCGPDRIASAALVLISLLLMSACTGATPEAAIRPTATVLVQPAEAAATPTAPLPTATPEPTGRLEPSARVMATAAATADPTPSASATAMPMASPLASVTPQPTSTPLPAHTPTSEATPTNTAVHTHTPVPFPPVVALEPLLAGLERPLYLTHGGDPSLVYVVEKAGQVLLLEDGVLRAEPFLDIRDRVRSQASEQGLLSIAFPPRDQGSVIDEFYVNYTDQQGSTVIARYRLQEDDPRRGDATSEQLVLQIAQPASNHNGGQLQFGPDGKLYVGMGDGGQGGDPWGNAQNPESLLGKLLRLDVVGAETYRIPADNAFLGEPDVRPEIWALGLRNPWRFSFDRFTGDLYIADVGQNLYEEVHVQPAGSSGGQNYGWDIMEGTHCFEPASGCDQTGLVLPVAEYEHSVGCSITGGHVYRGSRYPSLIGIFFYGDFCSGNIWGLRRHPSGEWEQALVLPSGITISSFGEDALGELYVLGYNEGTLYRLVAVD